MCHKKEGAGSRKHGACIFSHLGHPAGLRRCGWGLGGLQLPETPVAFGAVLTVLGRDVYKCLFTPDRTLVTAQSSDSTQVHLGKPMSFGSLKNIIEGFLTGA